MDRPLCVVGRKHSRNHFESLEYISGAVLKGAVAQLILNLSDSRSRVIDENTSSDFPKVCKHFSSIRFSEARPRHAESKVRPVEPPLSVVRSPLVPDRFFDVALEENPSLIEGLAPAFRLDWKGDDYEIVGKAFGSQTLPRERRTRTAINEETWRAADEQLFSYGLVLPDRKSKTGEVKFVWDGSVGLEAVPEADRKSIRDELGRLLKYGIPNIGKTRAVGAVQWLEKFVPPVTGSVNSKDFFVVTLQTECLMTNPETLGSGTAETLQQAYKEFWAEISSNKLSLTRFFARQSLYGGFVSRRSNANKYEPFLLTDRGSVFVLEPTNGVSIDDVADVVNGWSNSALGVPDWVVQRYAGGDEQLLWQRCPFLPHVGYGEVAVNLECHFNSPVPVVEEAGAVS